MVTKAFAVRSTHATTTVLVTALGLLVAAGLWSAPAKARASEQGKIAFVRLGDLDCSGFGGNIWVRNDDGSGPAQLTQGWCDSVPAWSPNGERIAFTRFDPEGSAGDIWVMNADGSDQTNLTNNPDHPPHSNDTRPTWSPDGERIAFARVDPEGSWPPDVWLMNADGSDVTRLIRDAWDPAWSPDGQRIVFIRDANIWAINVDGSDEAVLADDMTSQRSSPAWSPDGQRIAFGEFVDWSEWELQSFLSVMNADGSDVTRLLRDAWDPDWSSAGRIAFATARDIWAMNADGSCLTPLVRGPTLDRGPAWHPSSPSETRPCFRLSVSIAGTGAGAVTGSPSHCGSIGQGECAVSIAAGTELALRAWPDLRKRRSWFTGWGGACTGMGRCRLTMNGDRHVIAHFGMPRLRVRARPPLRRVGPDRRRVRYRFVVRNVGDGPTPTIVLCAGDPLRRVRILGERCVARQIPAGARRQRAVRVRIRPAARGKLTRIRLMALGNGVENQQTVARLRVRR